MKHDPNNKHTWPFHPVNEIMLSTWQSWADEPDITKVLLKLLNDEMDLANIRQEILHSRDELELAEPKEAT
jgi:hypothetical protein